MLYYAQNTSVFPANQVRYRLGTAESGKQSILRIVNDITTQLSLKINTKDATQHIISQFYNLLNFYLIFSRQVERFLF